LGFIEWDRDTGQIATGPDWDDIEAVIELIYDHLDELPDGWLLERACLLLSQRVDGVVLTPNIDRTIHYCW